MNVTIKWDYLPVKGKEPLLFESKPIPVTTVIPIVNDIEKTGRVKELLFVDEQGSEWSKKEILKYLKGVEDEPHNITLTFDGGFEHTSNKAGLGITIHFTQNKTEFRIRKNQCIEGIQSNNEAEYAALWFGIQELENLGAHHIPVTIQGDSLVVINQLTEEWPCYEEELLSWIERIEKKVADLGFQVNYSSLSRKNNKEADHLASQALQGTEISSQIAL
ncbi:reverse transcriptase-like protein [Bacillus alkalicellulosilyticus]|uniref:reverse transcriptase-like protein n=1 Tax=Alkalihalobacterium alkalicellulosilyticum TaxID=1912214 RepID=UPI00099753F9|nr:reverse transcriptase-like protein [Bacillus alkalicellulosilyticus]